MELFENASALHKSLLLLIQPDEKNKQNTWFSSIMKYKHGFIVMLKYDFLFIDLKQASRANPWYSATPGKPQETPPEGKTGAQEDIKKEPWSSLNFQRDV